VNAETMLALIEEGDAAYQDGLCLEECPYAPKSLMWEYWCEGWREAYDADAPARESEAEDRRLDDPRHQEPRHG
jgi:ribosome modulation factor